MTCGEQINFPVRQGVSKSIGCYGKTELGSVTSNSGLVMVMGCYSKGFKIGEESFHELL